MNRFYIETIDCEQAAFDIVVRYQVFIKAILEINCKWHGHKMQELIMTCEASGCSDTESVRKAIEMLLNHEYEPHFNFYMPKCECVPERGKIVYDFSNLCEPFRQLFEDLFKDENWAYPKELTL
jgi:hypothetical protein